MRRLPYYSLPFALVVLLSKQAQALPSCSTADLACREKTAAYCNAVGNAVMRRGSEANPPDPDTIARGSELVTISMQFQGNLLKTGYKLQYAHDKFQLLELSEVSAGEQVKECYRYFLIYMDDLSVAQRLELEQKTH